ncbi:phosphoribosylformylglycinamidine synthase, partial [bacterium]
LAYVYNQLGDEPPDLEDTELLKRTFKAITLLIAQGIVLAGHDRSDGGLVTTLLEMAFAGNAGLDINIKDNPETGKYRSEGASREIACLFSEESGLVLEYIAEDEEKISKILHRENIPFQVIGETTGEKRITIRFCDRIILNEDISILQDLWEETSFQLERIQANPLCAEEEKMNNSNRPGPSYTLGFSPVETPSVILKSRSRPKVAVIREEGSNSDREMTSAFYQGGFEPWDVTMSDILNQNMKLEGFKGLVFVGGFSFADVLDSAKGWAGVIRFNKRIWEDFENFYRRTDTFSLGVCNGCQLMALLGWVPWNGIAREQQPRFIRNISGRFESRFSSVKIMSSPSLMLQGMEGSVLGIWVAHGEGRAYFPDEDIYREIEDSRLAPIRYVDDDSEVTMKYPFNPNGSHEGIAALCSRDGRHLAIMPHPERTFLTWQWPWMPESWRKNLKVSPWLQMFQNARKWCEER